jgi:SPFH domain / Band 7 family
LKRANEFNIELEDVSITHMTFGKEFTRAVEQKQIAQQDAERARFTVEKVVPLQLFTDFLRLSKNVKQMLFVLKEKLSLLI